MLHNRLSKSLHFSKRFLKKVDALFALVRGVPPSLLLLFREKEGEEGLDNKADEDVDLLKGNMGVEGEEDTKGEEEADKGAGNGKGLGGKEEEESRVGEIKVVVDPFGHHILRVESQLPDIYPKKIRLGRRI